MSPILKFLPSKTKLENFDVEIRKETLRDARALVEDIAERIAVRMRREMARRGPTPAGTPVGRDDGYLQASIGSSKSEVHGNSVTAFLGVGAGAKGREGVDDAKSAGVNVFEYAHTQEYGGVVKNGRRYPARSYLRYTIELMEAEVDAILGAAL